MEIKRKEQETLVSMALEGSEKEFTPTKFCIKYKDVRCNKLVGNECIAESADLHGRSKYRGREQQEREQGIGA